MLSKGYSNVAQSVQTESYVDTVAEKTDQNCVMAGHMVTVGGFSCRKNTGYHAKDPKDSNGGGYTWEI
jgi:hypothetical protein